MKESINLVWEYSPAAIYILIFILGGLVGSFLNVCIYRIPKKESIVTVPSHCMSCGKQLKWWELVPVFSYICLRGKCSGCKAKISPQYWIVETANALIWTLVLFVKGPCLDMIFFQLLFSCLLVIGVIDARTKEIPFPLVVFIFVIGLARALVRIFVFGDKWADYLLGFVVMFAFFEVLIIVTSLIYEGGGLGGGDQKLCTVVGLFLGLKLTALGFVLGCFVGSVIHLTLMALKKKGRELAFGPYLGIGFAISALWGTEMISWYTEKFLTF